MVLLKTPGFAIITGHQFVPDVVEGNIKVKIPKEKETELKIKDRIKIKKILMSKQVQSAIKQST